VQVRITPGRTAFVIVGLPDKAVAAQTNNWHVLPFIQLGAKMTPEPEHSEEMQAADALFALRAQEAAAQVRSDMDGLRKTALKLAGDNQGTLTGLVDLWKKIRQPRNPQTESDTRKALQRFITINGDLPPEDVTPDHVRRYRDKLDDSGHSRIVVTKSLERLRSVFATAVAEGKVATNAFYKIEARGHGRGKVSDRRMPFSREQIKVILCRLGELRHDDRMVMKLMIYHGARPAELCQLRTVDVLDVDGISALRLTDEAGSLKTASSERSIPIHPACRAEVLALAERRRERGKALLFDYEFIKSKGNRSHRFSERISRWLRNRIGITDKRVVAYSARHSFKDMCRATAMPEYIANQLMGHVLARGDAGGYGVGVSMAELDRWLAKIEPLRS
jgi:integrase